MTFNLRINILKRIIHQIRIFPQSDIAPFQAIIPIAITEASKSINKVDNLLIVLFDKILKVFNFPIMLLEMGIN